MRVIDGGPADPNSDFAKRAQALAEKIVDLINAEITPYAKEGEVLPGEIGQAIACGAGGGVGAFLASLVPVEDVEGDNDFLLNSAAHQMVTSFAAQVNMRRGQMPNAPAPGTKH